MECRGAASSFWYGTLAYERHLGEGPGGISERQAKYTGYDHVLVSGGIEWGGNLVGLRTGRTVAELDLEFAPGAEAARTGFLRIGAYLKYRRADRGFAPFLGFTYGSDDYNILFDNWGWRVLVGLSYDATLLETVSDI
jgi:hypothetical protein